MGFPRQEYWSGLPVPPPGDLLNPGTELGSPALADGFFTIEPPGKLYVPLNLHFKGLTPRNSDCDLVWKEASVIS